MFGLGAGEILVIGVVAFILFGPQKLPEVARGIGRAIRRFKEETAAMTKEDKDVPQQQDTVSDKSK